MSFLNIIKNPDMIIIKSESKSDKAKYCGNNSWELEQIKISLPIKDNKMTVQIEAINDKPECIILHWKHEFNKKSLFLNDHWERGYGDLAWLPMDPERVSPWYFMHYDGNLTHGYGVMTGTSSMAFWQITEQGIYLWLDVRCGGVGIDLSSRVLNAAEVVCREGKENESSFLATKEFCKIMCPNPRLPKERIYGGNNWYTDYGNTSKQGVIAQAKTISSLAGNQEVRPFMLVDDGWQVCHFEACAGGPWTSGNYLFPKFEELAGELKQEGVRPGLWFRPLFSAEQFPQECILPQKRFKTGLENGFTKTQYLDPSSPYVLDKVTQDINRFTEWGFELIKHDFSTYDILGRWGFQMGGIITNKGWSFFDKTKTTAEIIKDFYMTLRNSAKDAYIMGCNTISHLSAGIFELNRTGDDTSGREWNRTRKMGVNTLAFRYPQHNAFYASDPDCIGLTKDVPWELNKQFMELTAYTGSPLFISIELSSLNQDKADKVSELFAKSQNVPLNVEPLDWLNNKYPVNWKIDEKEFNFNWYPDFNVDLHTEVFNV